MKSSKNIIIGPGFPLRGGIANFNNALCDAFLQSKVDSQIFSFSLQYPSFLFPGKTQFETGEISKKIKIKTIINSINPFNWFKVSKMIKAEAPDYVIIRYWLPFMAPCLGTIARLIKRNTNIKILSIVDNIIPHEKRFGDRFLSSYFVKSCDGFITLSSSVLHELEEFTSSSNKVFVPHPIYDIFGEKVSKLESLKQLNLIKGKKYILFFGFIRKYKGLDILLNALSDGRLLDVTLIVAGEFYDDFKEYQDLVIQLGIEDQVIFHNQFIPSDKVKYYFCAADMVVQTYRTATQSGVTQIAYHFERPMLVTNVGGLSEIVSHNTVGYVTEVDARSVSAAIYDFYNEKREVEFSRNTEKQKHLFSWSNLVKNIQQMVSNI